MSRLDDVISYITYIHSALIAYRQIVESGDCNSCSARKTCKYTTKFGELVRYNCPFYREAATESIERPKSLGYDARPKWPFEGSEE